MKYDPTSCEPWALFLISTKPSPTKMLWISVDTVEEWTKRTLLCHCAVCIPGIHIITHRSNESSGWYVDPAFTRGLAVIAGDTSGTDRPQWRQAAPQTRRIPGPAQCSLVQNREIWPSLWKQDSFSEVKSLPRRRNLQSLQERGYSASFHIASLGLRTVKAQCK